jgi:hypothetical protein
MINLASDPSMKPIRLFCKELTIIVSPKKDIYVLNRHWTNQAFFDRIAFFAGAMITPSQCRAARGLLDWSQLDLAKQSHVGVVTIRQLEAGVHQPRTATLIVVRQTLERAGVIFIDENGGGAGVRLRKPNHPS